jgi:outer membrane murein-binding lipoprotein Lpp
MYNGATKARRSMEMKQWSAILVLGIVIIWLASTAGCQSNTGEIETLKSKLNSLEAKQTELVNKIVQVESDFKAIKELEGIPGPKGDPGPQGPVGPAGLSGNGRIDELNRDLERLENELCGGHLGCAGYYDKIGDIEEAIDDLEERIGYLELEVGSPSSDILSLQSDVASLETEVYGALGSSWNSRIDDLKRRVEDLESGW